MLTRLGVKTPVTIEINTALSLTQELAAMFPWHKLNSTGDSEEKVENIQVTPPK